MICFFFSKAYESWTMSLFECVVISTPNILGYLVLIQTLFIKVLFAYPLTHWGRVTHICVSKLTFIGSDNGLSPGRRQAIIWTNAEILSIGPLRTNFSENLIGIQTFSFKKMRLKVWSAKRRPFCLGLNELSHGGMKEYMQLMICL